MSNYRDEKETLRRRVQTLERRLAELSADDRDDEATIARLTEERDALREERDHLASRVEGLLEQLEPPPPPEPVEPPSAQWKAFGLVGVAFVGAAMLMALGGDVGRLWLITLGLGIGALLMGIYARAKQVRPSPEGDAPAPKRKRRKRRARVETRPPKELQMEARKRRGRRKRRRRR